MDKQWVLEIVYFRYADKVTTFKKEVEEIFPWLETFAISSSFGIMRGYFPDEELTMQQDVALHSWLRMFLILDYRKRLLYGENEAEFGVCPLPQRRNGHSDSRVIETVARHNVTKVSHTRKDAQRAT